MLFVQEPGFGDDLTYWSFAHDLHESGLKAWGAQSFHDLRWPVWGVSWALQGCGLQGISAYTGVAIFYLMAGASCAFAFGWLVFRSRPLAWAAGLAFVMCPLIDTVCHRPMPDLSEGVWGGATLLAWWALMHATSRRASLVWASLMGLGVYLAESNRLTGVFIVPVLFIATLVLARRRLGWLVIAGGFALLFYAAEAAFYHHLFQDWLHNLHANQNAKGDKGVTHVPFLTSPFRFVYVLWKVGRLAPLYSLLALAGIGGLGAQRCKGAATSPAGSLMALWSMVLYLEYACAPQSLSPWQPVIRAAARFLGGLAIPYSLLAVMGARWLLSALKLPERRRFIKPFFVGAVGLLLLVTFTSRPFFDLGFLKEMRAYVRRVPSGTKVFTHHMMRSLAIMSDPSSAQRLAWSAAPEIMDLHPDLERAAAAADEFWYMHKIIWMPNRKRMEKKRFSKQPPLASYFERTDEQWTLAGLIVKEHAPDLVFYRRCPVDAPPPEVLTAASRELGGAIPMPPLTWAAPQERAFRADWLIPPTLRGKCLRLEAVASSEQVEPAFVAFRFESTGAGRRDLVWKPYCYAEPGRDFFLLPIPRSATRCTIRLRFLKTVQQVTLTDFRASVLTPLDGVSWVSGHEATEE